MIFHENRLPADDSHDALFVIFEKAAKFEIVVCCKLLVAFKGLILFLPFITTVICSLVCLCTLVALISNDMNPDQTAILMCFASMIIVV